MDGLSGWMTKEKKFPASQMTVQSIKEKYILFFYNIYILIVNWRDHHKIKNKEIIARQFLQKYKYIM